VEGVLNDMRPMTGGVDFKFLQGGHMHKEKGYIKLYIFCDDWVTRKFAAVKLLFYNKLARLLAADWHAGCINNMV
jgi:hypothetical protein